jgi:hypothetical protein
MPILPQPFVPVVTSADVRRLARREYPGADFQNALAMLETAQASAPAGLGTRVCAAALKVSAGNVTLLRRALENARGDPEELLRRAEWPGYRQIEVRIRNRGVPRELQQRIMDEDREQYEGWFHGKD